MADQHREQSSSNAVSQSLSILTCQISLDVSMTNSTWLSRSSSHCKTMICFRYWPRADVDRKLLARRTVSTNWSSSFLPASIPFPSASSFVLTSIFFHSIVNYALLSTFLVVDRSAAAILLSIVSRLTLILTRLYACVFLFRLNTWWLPVTFIMVHLTLLLTLLCDRSKLASRRFPLLIQLVFSLVTHSSIDDRSINVLISLENISIFLHRLYLETYLDASDKRTVRLIIFLSVLIALQVIGLLVDILTKALLKRRTKHWASRDIFFVCLERFRIKIVRFDRPVRRSQGVDNSTVRFVVVLTRLLNRAKSRTGLISLVSPRQWWTDGDEILATYSAHSLRITIGTHNLPVVLLCHGITTRAQLFVPFLSDGIVVFLVDRVESSLGMFSLQRLSRWSLHNQGMHACLLSDVHSSLLWKAQLDSVQMSEMSNQPSTVFRSLQMFVTRSTAGRSCSSFVTFTEYRWNQQWEAVLRAKVDDDSERSSSKASSRRTS